MGSRRFFHITLFAILFIAFAGVQVLCAQMVVDAGSNKNICPGQSVTIGGSPTVKGGKPPYKIRWSPKGKSIPQDTIANPTVSPDSSMTYFVVVTDSLGNTNSASVNVIMDPVSQVYAGLSRAICIGSNIVIGGPRNGAVSGITFTWSPDTAFSDPTLPNPLITPTITATYTLVAKSAACPPQTSYVTVYVKTPPPLSAGPDFTINEGEKVTLKGSGAIYYRWNPDQTLKYANTANPDAEPGLTTTYYVSATVDSICFATDTMVVTVLPSDELIFYNTFTPNKDGDNDFWYIGNIYKYPDNELEIYNRYGKLVYRGSGYLNDWDGTNFGEMLPSATYYYILDTKKSKVYNGSITIIR